jgi:hypothetical protein
MAYFWNRNLVMRMQKILVLALMLMASAVSAQDIFGPMKAAIKAGNADELAKHFNQNLDVNIEGNLNAFSKTQATFAVAEFFKAHPVKDFAVVHKGTSQGGLQFAIGKYVSGGDTYTVMMRVKEVSKTMLIHDISFVKEKKP